MRIGKLEVLPNNPHSHLSSWLLISLVTPRQNNKASLCAVFVKCVESMIMKIFKVAFLLYGLAWKMQTMIVLG